MQLKIKVIPQSKKNQIKQDGDMLKVYLTAPAVDGKANKALIKALAEYFDVKKGAIEIKRGTLSRNKIIIINGVKK